MIFGIGKWNWKLSPSFSLFTTLNPTGWTVTKLALGIVIICEGGLAVWERFEELNIEYYD